MHHDRSLSLSSFILAWLDSPWRHYILQSFSLDVEGPDASILFDGCEVKGERLSIWYVSVYLIFCF